MNVAVRSRAKKGVFYGWWVVLASAVVSFYGGGTFFYGFTAFFNPIRNTFGWTSAQTSLAFTLQRLEGGIAAPLVGFLFDKLGPRRLMLFGCAVAGLGFIVISRIDSLWALYGAFVVASIGFSFSTGGVGMASVANWFIKKRGRALGLLMAGFGASGVIAPILVWLISQYGWRTSLVIIGIGMWLVGIPASMFVRHKPEQYGYMPDGEIAKPSSDQEGTNNKQDNSSSLQETQLASERASAEVAYTARQALRTRAFWAVSLAYSLSHMTTSAVMVHEMPYLESVGVSREMAGLVVTFITLFSLLGRIGFAWLADTYDKRYILAVTFALQAIGTFIFAYVRDMSLLIPFLVAYAPGYGGAIPVRPALQGEYFGRLAFGTIQGLFMAITTIGGLLGPILAGWIFDSTGSYYSAWVIFASTTVLAVPLTLAATRPVPRSELASTGLAIAEPDK